MIRLLRSEFLKIRTTRTVYWLLVLTAVLAAVITALFTLFQVISETPVPLGTIEGQRAIFGNLATQSGAQIVMLCLGVLSLGAEFRHGTITSTLLGTPRRARVVLAKLATVVLVGLVFAVVAIVVALAVYLIWMRIKGETVTLTGDIGRILVGNALVLVLYGAIGMGVGALIRNQIVAIIVAILYAWILDGLVALAVNAVKPLRDAGVAGYLPGQAAAGLQWAPEPVAQEGVPAFTQIHYLPQWAGGLVLVAWALVFCLLGIRLALSRDIT
jgi:ABC-type transport system involved in multi-copper enzyme maturation permease subunit